MKGQVPSLLSLESMASFHGCCNLLSLFQNHPFSVAIFLPSMAFFHPSISLPFVTLVSSTPKHHFLLNNLYHKAYSQSHRSCIYYSPSLSRRVKCNDDDRGSKASGEDGGKNLALKMLIKLYSQLIRNIGSNIVFMVYPTIEDGTTFGVKWQLGGSKMFMPWGKGFIIQSYHGFKGKLLIRNVEMMMEPLLQLNPIRLKMIAAIASIMEKTMNLKFSRGASMALGFFFLVLSLFFLQFSVS